MKLFFVGVSSLVADQFFELYEDHPLASEIELSLWDDENGAGRSLMINGHSTLVRPVEQAPFTEASIVILAQPDVSADLLERASSGATLIDLYSNLSPESFQLAVAGRDCLESGEWYQLAEPVLVAVYKFCHAIEAKVEPLRMHIAATLPASVHDRKGAEALARETAALLNGREATEQFLDATLAFNALAQPFVLDDNEESGLERRIADGADELFEDAEVTVSTVQVPMFHGTSVMLMLETQADQAVPELVALIDRDNALRFSHSPNASTQSMIGQTECLVSRLRVDARVDQTIQTTLMFDENRFGRASALLELLGTLVTKH